MQLRVDLLEPALLLQVVYDSAKSRQDDYQY